MQAPVDISTWRSSRQRQARLRARRVKFLRTLNATWARGSSNRRRMGKQWRKRKWQKRREGKEGGRGERKKRGRENQALDQV